MLFSSFVGLVRWLAALVFLSMGPMAWAQAPAWQLATVMPPNNGGLSAVNAMTTDAAGNVYVTGSFTDSVRVGSVVLNSATRHGFFVAKWQPTTQTFAWAQRVACSRFSVVRGVAVGTSGVYVCGKMDSTTTFGVLTQPRTGQGQANAFVAKLADAGTSASFQWVEQIGGNGFNQANTLVANGTAVYLTGAFSGIGQFGNNSLRVVGSQDAFLTKITDNGATGTLAWAVQTGGSGSETGIALAVNGPLIYMGGSFSGTPVAGSTAVSTGGSDLVVARYTDTGTTAQLDWTQQTGGPGADAVYGLAVSGTSIYATGNFNLYSPNIMSIAGYFGPAAVAATPYGNAFVCKLTDQGSSGRLVWANVFGHGPGDVALAIAARGPEVVVSGYYNNGQLLFPGTVALTKSSNFSYSFVARLTDQNSGGVLRWATQAVSSRGSSFDAVALAPNGTLYVGGAAGVPVQFGAIAIAAPGPWFTVGCLASLGNAVLATRPAGPAVSFELAPNPARATTTVQLPAGSAPAILTVLDVLGRPVHTQTATGSQTELDLAGLAPGLYAVRVQAGAATATRRLVVE